MNLVNRRVNFDYTILRTFDAGIQLFGVEVKTLRLNNGSINGAYCNLHNGEVFVVNMHIPRYRFSQETYNEYRARKLLLHRSEINKLIKSHDQHKTIVPTEVYFNDRGYVKIKIALCQGKKAIDKRKTIKEREVKKDRAQALKQYLK